MHARTGVLRLELLRLEHGGGAAMISIPTARALRTSGVTWEPAAGDRFVITDRGMDADVFVLSDMVVEAHDFPTGRVLGFNGTTEWALDSVEAEQTVWLPRESQLREMLGEAFRRLERREDRWAVTVASDEERGERTHEHADPEEAYALAVLSLRARLARAAG